MPINLDDLSDVEVVERTMLAHLQRSNRIGPRHIFSGRHCTFIKHLDAGLKIYEDKKIGALNYKRQQRLSKIGLAPKCWAPAKTRVLNKTVFFYYTEVVKTAYQESSNAFHKAEDRAYRFEEELKDIGIYWHDTYGRNIGWKDGRVILIDFDDLVFTQRFERYEKERLAEGAC